MTAYLPELDSGATALATTGWREGHENVDFDAFTSRHPREPGLPDLDLEAVRLLVDQAMKDFATNVAASDAWLAPRIHSALRLTRREAARRGLWRHLAVVLAPDYVRWRFASVTSERFFGDPSKHSIARLWWVAEMFRNGPDYRPVVLAFGSQDLINYLFRLDIAHHRPTVQAAVAVMFPSEGQGVKLDEANALAKAANVSATTLLIDALAPDEPLDPAARTEWMKEEVDALRIVDDLPSGPNDPEVPGASVATMTDLFARLLPHASIRPSRRPRED